ncbi:MAG TPA: murein biosynthesis integral membrane protein MurJ [Clostridiaceae bacterium]|nr:murein biosynthesis integral membrane protein MurJ [Clostridiaceae bacterium]
MESSSDSVKKLTGAAGLVMFGTFLSRITGFLRNVLITTQMKPMGYSDEFILAFTLPDLVYDLLAGGAIAAAFIPILSTYLSKDQERTGWKAISTFMNLSVILMVVLEIVFFIFTDSFMAVFASGYKEGASGDKELLIRLTRILLLNAPFMMLAGQLNGILNSYKRFAVAAFGPVIYNICTILSIGAFGARNAELTAWGVVAGGAVFFVIQFSGAFRHFVNYRPKLFLKSEAFRELIHQAVPSLISSTIIEINVIISRNYATFYEAGMVTILNNANKTWQLPLGIFAQSIGIALLPTLSEHYAKENPEEYKKVLYKGLRVVFLLSFITSVIMMILSGDIMRILFKWGSGSEYDVFYGGLCLMAYSATLVFSSMIALMTRAFYSVHDSRTPLFGGVLGIAILYLLNVIFRNLTGIGIAGTALAYSMSQFVIMMVYMLLFRRKTGIDIITDNFGYIVKAMIGAVPTGIAVYGLSVLIRPDIGSKISQIAAICVPVAVGLGLFWLILLKLRVSEIKFINDLVLSKLKIFRRS